MWKDGKLEDFFASPGGGLRFICFSTSFWSSFNFSASSSISLTRALIASSSCNKDKFLHQPIIHTIQLTKTLITLWRWLLCSRNKCWPTTKSSCKNIILWTVAITNLWNVPWQLYTRENGTVSKTSLAFVNNDTNKTGPSSEKLQINYIYN